jgi:hypothetical protein
VRLAAVKRLDPATHGDVLAQVAVEDQAREVRQAAKKRLVEAPHKAKAEDNEAKAEDWPAPGM